MGLGDHIGRGIDHIAIPGLVKRFIGSHFVLSPRQQRAIAANSVEAIGLPAGTISLLYREIAARRAGLFTDIGLDTFVDPRQQWGRLNARTTTGSASSSTSVAEWLFYPRSTSTSRCFARERTPTATSRWTTKPRSATTSPSRRLRKQRRVGHRRGQAIRRRGETRAQVRIPGASSTTSSSPTTPTRPPSPSRIRDGRARTGRHRCRTAAA